jgi:hypothetical protein
MSTEDLSAERAAWRAWYADRYGYYPRTHTVLGTLTHPTAVESASLDAYLAGRASSAVAVPAGWALVPVEPTDAMLSVLTGFHFRGSFDPQQKALREGVWKAMLAATPAPPQAAGQGWMPIETAPKDGSSVLIYRPEASRQKVMEAYWAMPYEDAPADQCWWSTPHGATGRGYTILPKAVTHWMPLPPAPGAAPPQAVPDTDADPFLQTR